MLYCITKWQFEPGFLYCVNTTVFANNKIFSRKYESNLLVASPDLFQNFHLKLFPLPKTPVFFNFLLVHVEMDSCVDFEFWDLFGIRCKC